MKNFLQLAGQMLCILLFFYTMYFLWINTPPYDYPMTGIRWYYNPPR